MDPGIKEPKPLVNGIPPKVICHLTHHDGPGITCQPHYHTYIEMLYCLSGDMDVWLNDSYYKFQRGDLLIVNSNEVHTIKAVAPGVHDYIVLRFEPEILYDSSQSILEVKYVLPFILNNNTPQKVFSHPEIYFTQIPQLMKDSLSEYEKKEYGYELAIRSNICRIFLWILRHWHHMGISLSPAASGASELITKLQVVLDYIAEHYDENISAYDMAKLCNLSYSYFSRTFKQTMRRSFNDYLNFIRVTEAEKLLMSTDMNTTEIAYAVGFSSASYFIKIFHEHKQVSPSKFKKNFMEEI